MENQIDFGKRNIVLFSGGYDSTYVLAEMVSTAPEGSTVYTVTIEHNITGCQKLRREYESQLLIIRELNKHFPKVKIKHERITVESNWTIGDTCNSVGLSQPILWMCNLIPFLEDGDTFYVGYNQNDQAVCVEPSIRNMLDAALQIQDSKDVKLSLPLRWMAKSEVMYKLISKFDYLVDYCTSCESMQYDGTEVCGGCVPCKHLKEALLNIAISEPTVSGRALDILKDKFNIDVQIHDPRYEPPYPEPLYPDDVKEACACYSVD